MYLVLQTANQCSCSFSNKLTVNHRTFYLCSTYLLLLLFHLVRMVVWLGIGLSSLSVAWSTLTPQGILNDGAKF